MWEIRRGPPKVRLCAALALTSSPSASTAILLAMHPPQPTPTFDSDSRVEPGRRSLVVMIAVAVALYLNYWLWGDDGIVLGLPVNLLYHLLLTVALSAFMVVLVRRFWPRYLDEEGPQ